MYFNRNLATLGGAIYLANYSTLNANNLYASQNKALYGGVIGAIRSCNISWENCFLSENTDHRLGAAIEIFNKSVVIVSSLKCLRQIGNIYSCIYAEFNCTVSVYNSTFAMNTGSALMLTKNSHLIVINSKFVNNLTPKYGAVILSLNNSLIDVSYSIFDHNKANRGGAIYQETSKSSVKHCSFFSNSNGALVGNNDVSVENFNFENNVDQCCGGAVRMLKQSVLNISQTTFKNNKQNSINFNALQSLNQNIGTNTTVGGGAIWLTQSVGNISKSAFYNNYASLAGGAMFIYNSSLSVSSTTFENNVAVIGGAISSRNSILNAEYSHFKNNSVLNKTVGFGGGLYLYGNSTMKISNVLFSECHASFGGAIAANLSQIIMASTSLIANTGSATYLFEENSVDINNCTFFNNSTPFNGGAILCAIHCDVKMVDSNFNKNRAVGGGGSVFVNKIKNMSKFTVHNCSFSYNMAYVGGAMYVKYSDFSISNSNYSNNIGTEGGVIALVGVGVMTNCHISNNTARANGGVVKVVNGTLQLSECQVSNNTANSYGGVGLSIGSTIVITNCIFKTNSAHGIGGVFFVQNTTTLLRNSSFVKNFAAQNGGVFGVQLHSVINITESLCFENQAKHIGGVLYARLDTKVLISDTEISQNSGFVFGAICIDDNSVLELSGSQVVNNNAQDSVGALYISNNSLLVASNSSFKGNKAYQDSCLTIENSIAYLEKCTFMENFQTFYGGTISMKAAILKVANTFFTHNTGYDIYYDQIRAHFINRLDTYSVCLNVTIFH